MTRNAGIGEQSDAASRRVLHVVRNWFAFATTVCHCLEQAVPGQRATHCFCEAVAHWWSLSPRSEKCGPAAGIKRRDAASTKNAPRLWSRGVWLSLQRKLINAADAVCGSVHGRRIATTAATATTLTATTTTAAESHAKFRLGDIELLALHRFQRGCLIGGEHSRQFLFSVFAHLLAFLRISSGSPPELNNSRICFMASSPIDLILAT